MVPSRPGQVRAGGGNLLVASPSDGPAGSGRRPLGTAAVQVHSRRHRRTIDQPSRHPGIPGTSTAPAPPTGQAQAGSWQRLPAASIPGGSTYAGVWTGSELLVHGPWFRFEHGKYVARSVGAPYQPTNSHLARPAARPGPGADHGGRLPHRVDRPGAPGLGGWAWTRPTTLRPTAGAGCSPPPCPDASRLPVSGPAAN